MIQEDVLALKLSLFSHPSHKQVLFVLFSNLSKLFALPKDNIKQRQIGGKLIHTPTHMSISQL